MEKNNQVKMEVKKEKKAAQEEPKELTYEQLSAACSQLYQEKQMLIKRLEYMNQTNVFKRLDYLFLVLKYANVIKDSDFILECIEEIKGAIRIPEDTETSEE